MFTKSNTTTCFLTLLIFDSVIKLVTLMMNTHPFIHLIAKFKSPKCHELMEVDEYFMIFLKVASIFIMCVLGIRGTIRGSNGGGLGEWRRFRIWFNIYVGVWTLGKTKLIFHFLIFLALVSICVEALVSSCSKMPTKERLIVASTMLFVGLFFLFVYFVVWQYFIVNTEKYLRENSDFSNFGSGL